YHPAHRPIWRLAAQPHALSARSVRRGARGVSVAKTGRLAAFLDRLDRGWLGSGADDSIRRGIEKARRRLDRRVLRRRVAVAKNSARPRLSGAIRASDQA